MCRHVLGHTCRHVCAHVFGHVRRHLRRHSCADITEKMREAAEISPVPMWAPSHLTDVEGYSRALGTRLIGPSGHVTEVGRGTGNLHAAAPNRQTGLGLWRLGPRNLGPSQKHRWPWTLELGPEPELYMALDIGTWVRAITLYGLGHRNLARECCAVVVSCSAHIIHNISGMTNMLQPIFSSDPHL